MHGIPDANELAIATFPPGNLAHCRPSMQPDPDLLHRPRKGRSYSIKLVHKNDPGDRVKTRLGPHFLRLSLHARDAVEDTYGTVEDPQGAEDFEGEVCVAGGVNEIDVVRVGGAGGGGEV